MFLNVKNMKGRVIMFRIGISITGTCSHPAMAPAMNITPNIAPDAPIKIGATAVKNSIKNANGSVIKPQKK